MSKTFLFGFLSFFFVATQSYSYYERAQTAQIDNTFAQWVNPAGMAFIKQVEMSALYGYQIANRPLHRSGMNLGINFAERFTMGFGMQNHLALAKNSRENIGSDIGGIFSLAIKAGSNVGLGFAVNKRYNFLRQKSGIAGIGLGFQYRINRHLALGGVYEKIHPNFFDASLLRMGLGIRPWREQLTIEMDLDLMPRTSIWAEGLKINPSLSLKGHFNGFVPQFGVQFSDVRNGFKLPLFVFGIEFNFEHAGLSTQGSVDPLSSTNGIEGRVRFSNARHKPIISPTGLWTSFDIDADGSIERPGRSWADRLFSEEVSPLNMMAMLTNLKEDPRMAGVILNFDHFNFGRARAEEWRNVIADLRSSGKEVLVHLSSPSILEYYVASAATYVFMNPNGSISFDAFSNTLVYLADSLKKIGVEVYEVTAGDYKTAPRMWTRAQPSKEEVEVSKNILTYFYETSLNDISLARNIDKTKLKNIFDQGEITASQALTYGLVDSLSSKDEVVDNLVDTKEIPVAVLYDYHKMRVKTYDWAKPKTIAVVPLFGDIVQGRVYPNVLDFFGDKVGDKDFQDGLLEAVEDPRVAAIIVRIDSPGGDALASHNINRAIEKARAKKPIIVSIGDMAASGGYMAASAGTVIFAPKNAITGSIGVFSLFVSGEELAKKIGLHTHELTLIKNPGGSIFRKNRPQELANAQKVVDWHYDNFIDTVAKGLNRLPEDVRKHARGHVWLGNEALEHQLIHRIGGFNDALSEALKLSKVGEFDSVNVEVRPVSNLSPFSLSTDLIANLLNAKNGDNQVRELLRPYAQTLKAYEILGKPEARIPFDIHERVRR